MPTNWCLQPPIRSGSSEPTSRPHSRHPATAEYVQTRQLAWATRDTAGRECGTARPYVGTAKPFTPQARETITDMRGRTDATLGQLSDVVSRPGVAPELSKRVAEIRDIV